MDKCHCTPIKDKRQGIKNWISLKEEKKNQAIHKNIQRLW